MVEGTATLTRDAILAHPAGPRLDGLVSHYVMGTRRGDVIARLDRAWEPSERIEDAWEVVEKLLVRDSPGANCAVWAVVREPREAWIASLSTVVWKAGWLSDDRDEWALVAEAETAPLAICRVALLATMPDA